jgi:uncharacterized membrane protein
MKATTKLAIAAAGAGVIVRQVRASRVRVPATDTGSEPPNRWRAVTINKPADQVAAGGTLPQPLADLGDLVEVRVSQAPGTKGTELAARLRTPEPGQTPGALAGRLKGQDARQVVRSALRQSKQILEAGEVLQVDPRPAGHRTSSPAGKILDAVTRRAGSEGVL